MDETPGEEQATPDTPGETQSMPDRWTMIRDVAVFQVKLVVDGLRDFLLVPASLIVGIVALFGGDQGKPAPYFYQLLGVGKQTEQWINLFGAYRNAPEEVREAQFAAGSIDDIVQRAESFVVDEYQRGGITAQAKQQIDAALDAIQKRARQRSR